MTARPPAIFISPPTGESSLPIVEVSRNHVTTDRKRIRLKRGSKKRQSADCSFGPYQNHLAIDVWEFFHAAKKTELTTTFTSQQSDQRALLFAAEHSSFFHWNTGNLRRIDRSIFSLEDFSEASLAGRFGEAIAYLTMVKWGFVYWDRIAVLWERASAHSTMTHAERVRQAKVIASKLGVTRPDLEPDFVFEKDAGDVALVESKGSFVHPSRDNPSTKSDLRHALDQLDAWSGWVTPTPSKSFAIGTYFRDSSDATGDPSLIVYVDPPGTVNGEQRLVEFPRDWIRRGNYGDWLIGMGFVESGDALRRGVEVGIPQRPISIVDIGRRRFAVTIEGLVLKEDYKGRGLFPMFWPDPRYFVDELRFYPPSARSLREIGVAAFRIIGIDYDTLRLIERSMLNPATASLLQREARNIDLDRQTADGFTGSILPDGTLLGQIHTELFMDARLEDFRI